MTSTGMPRDIDRILDAWFEEGPMLAADRVVGAALAQAEHLPQARPSSPGRSVLLAAATLALILSIGVATWLATAPDRVEPTPRWRELPSVDAPLEPGRYVVGSPFPVRIGMTIAEGWGSLPLSDTHAQLDYLGLDDAGGGAALFFTFVEGVYIDPCHLEQGFLDPPPGPTVDEMAAALARIPGVSVTGPTDSTIGGYPAVTLSLTAPPAFEGCTGETDGPPFRLWGVPGWMAMDPGQRLRLWIVAVDGHRLMIGSQESADASPEALAAVNTLLATLQIEPEGEVARASPPPNELCNPCSPLPPGGPLAEGRYAVAMNLHRYVGDTPIPLSRPHRVTFDIVFGGWSSTDNGTATRSGASLTFWSVARIYRDPCHWRTSGMGAVEPTELGQLDSLARAFWDAWTPGMDGPGQGAPPFAPAVTEPIDETRYYHFAKRLKVKVPADVDVATCDGGEYRMWEDLEGRARAAREPGEHIRLWVVDLSPGLLVVDASSLPETLSADRGELDAMITSIWVELPRADAGP